MTAKQAKRIGGWRVLVVALLVAMICVPILPVNAFAAPASSAQPAKVVVHIVRSGETLFTIARIYRVSVKVIMAYNRISDPNQIQVGQKIYIPLPSDSKATFQHQIDHQRSL
ncbi:MAG: LysM peptidoglycan-binding domain-containing protein [Caldilineaceae bacterium]